MAVQYAFGKIVTQGLDLNVDAADPTSYPGSGTAWTSVVNRSITGSVVSCSFSSDFKGGIVFDNPSASVEFPGTVANYGTGSFTVEMAFRPSHIEGIHYLVSKNSGSYPNWGVYLSGSGGSGKLWAEYNIDASVSCSVSSSTTFETGSNYFVDVQLQPGISGSLIYNNGGLESGNLGNGGGSLTTTGSLFLGNTSPSSSQAYSGSLFFNRIYQTETLITGYNNYNPSKIRIQINTRPSALYKVLIVGGGGGTTDNYAGGGGAGGVLYREIPLSSATYNVFVGDGGNGVSVGPSVPTNTTTGTSSFFSSFTAFGGGGGAGYIFKAPDNGGSGGGGAAGNSTGGRGTPGQGFNGGSYDGSGGLGAGGGGASSPGQNSSQGGRGGSGSIYDISGTPVEYGRGGDGYQSGGRTGAGTPNTGNGASNSGIYKGGSGIVIIRYTGPAIATGGTITSVGGDTIHTFTETGSHTFTIF